jgi:hypothetical protein
MTTLLDPAIRAAIVAHLRATDPSAVVLHEVPIRYARGDYDAGRADVLTVSDVVSGYEIKSDADSFARLPKQVIAYEALCDFCTIVVGPKHLAHARAALPTSWGIVVAEAADRGVFLRRERLATRNSDVEPAAIARQLWKEEGVALLKEQGTKIDRRTPVYRIWPLVEALPLEVLRTRLRAALVDHENALKDVRVARRKEQRDRRRQEKEQREAREEWLAEIAARPGATT